MNQQSDNRQTQPGHPPNAQPDPDSGAEQRWWGSMLVWSGVTVALMAVLSAWAWVQLPADAQIPVHWGADGAVDRMGGKFEGLALVPLITVVMIVILMLVPRIEPRRRNLTRSRKAYLALWMSLLIFMLVVHSAMVLAALGHSFDMSRVIMVGLGVLFVMVGNYLPKVQSNFMVGIRTPWTLSSELSWHRTHRLAGWVFVLAGLVMLVLGALLGDGSAVQYRVLLPLWILMPGILLTVVYSWWVWRNDPDKDTSGR